MEESEISSDEKMHNCQETAREQGNIEEFSEKNYVPCSMRFAGLPQLEKTEKTGKCQGND